MAKNKNNQPQNNKNKKKYHLKDQTLLTPDKSADPPQPQGKNQMKEF